MERGKEMKHKFWALFLIVLLCITLSACSENHKPADTASKPAAVAENKAPQQSYPFEDDEGRMRYKLEINGSEVQTENLPFTYPDEPSGGYYPLEDVLSHLGVACLCSEDESMLTTKINGKVLKVTAGVAEMTYGSKMVKGFGTEAPVCIGNCLYVPSFLFMNIFDSAVVDFSSDRSTVTLETNATINLASSGTAGLSVPRAGTSGHVAAGGGSAGGSSGSAGQSICPVCNGTGKSVCTYCGGTGTKIEYQQTYDPVSKSYKQTQKRVMCPRCGGSGQVTCPSCGGTGKK